MKKLAVVFAISACAVVGWRAVRGGGGDGAAAQAEASDGGKLALDRIWIDHAPQSDRDIVSVFVAITDEPVGIFQSTSVWKGQHELFRYQAQGGELRVLYPQSGERERVRVKATACKERDFDYCLELSGASRGVARYYSRKGWEIDGAARPDELRARVGAQLGALVGARAAD